MTTVRLYGLTRGNGSYAQVLRGFVQAYRAHAYKERFEVVGIEERDDDDPGKLPTADAGIFLGPPIACSALRQHASHALRLVMVAPNSDSLPDATMYVVNEHATHLLAPSSWAAKVLERYTELPVLVVPHGIDQDYQITEDATLEQAYEIGEFRALHLSSSTRERKGTFELVQAWRRLRRHHELSLQSRLTLVVAPDTRARLFDWLVDEQESAENLGIDIRTRLGGGEGATPVEMRSLYAAHHVVVQPSRGEAFGMVPLEALATGVPIVATRATGHTEWFSESREGAVEVKTGDDEPIDDLPGARAPSVTIYAIASALEKAYVGWHELKASALSAAPSLKQEFSWTRQTVKLIEFIEGKAT